jgi:hypothetical protein
MVAFATLAGTWDSARDTAIDRYLGRLHKAPPVQTR